MQCTRMLHYQLLLLQCAGASHAAMLVCLNTLLPESRQSAGEATGDQIVLPLHH